MRPLAPGLFGPPGPGRGVGPRDLQLLNRAHGLLAAGAYDEAAHLFSQLAEGAEAREMPVRAAHLHLQTARALVGLGQTDAAHERIQRGLTLLRAAGLHERAARLETRIGEEMSLTSSPAASPPTPLLGRKPRRGGRGRG